MILISVLVLSIIGSMVIVDCVQNHPSLWAEKGCWNWMLKDAVLFDKPIEGNLGNSIIKLSENHLIIFKKVLILFFVIFSWKWKEIHKY